MKIILGILFVTITWGLFNRGRGWGDAKTKFGVWLSERCNRWTMGAASSLTLVLFAYTLHHWPNRTLLIMIPVTLLGWFFAVVHGIGEYQDGQKATNDEIEWIDAIARWKFKNKIVSAATVDNFSAGLRGIYRLPLYLALGVLLHTWWLILPALFFWTPGVCYQYIRPIVKGDYEFWVEWADFMIVGFLISVAITLSIITGF